MNIKEILTDKDNHYGFAIMILFIIIILFMIGANKDKEPGEIVNKYIKIGLIMLIADVFYVGIVRGVSKYYENQIKYY
jgi:hypothetical protein